MNLTLTKTITDNTLVVEDTTTYDTIVRADFASITFFSNRKSTGTVTTVGLGNAPFTDNQWSFDMPIDGVYEVEIVLIPTFNYLISVSPLTISKGTVTYDKETSLFYKALETIEANESDGSFIIPSENPEQWMEILPKNLYSVYSNLFVPQPDTNEELHTGSIEFVHYTNLISAYTELAKKITIPDCVCDDTQLEKLRQLRDKYEVVELAMAASNLLGAQIILEASHNLICTKSC